MSERQAGLMIAGVTPGDVLRGKYRITRVLGTGGMGVVVHAKHLKLDQDVAIKLLRPETSGVDRIVARFAREARAAARLKGEHVVRILDVDEGEGGAPFIVMEFLEGTDLERLVRKRGPLPVAESVEYVLQACEGLAEAHVLGIVHRDVKPANLFLTRTPRRERVVKVLDFGISKAPEKGDTTITEEDRVLGSPSFMSPEQLKAARDVDPRTDIWSLGVVLHCLLTGELPFAGESATELAARIASEPPRPVAEVRPDVPPELAAVVERCLRKDREERYASVAELAHALAPFVSEGGAFARRVSSVFRLPTPLDVPSGRESLTKGVSSRTLPVANRITASLDDAASVPGRETASIDAPGPVSIGQSTVPDQGQPRGPASSARPQLRYWLGAAALAAIVGLLVARGAPQRTGTVAQPVPEPPPVAVPLPTAIATAVLSAPTNSVAEQSLPAPSASESIPRAPTPTRIPSKAVRAHTTASSAPAPPDPLKLDLK